MLGENSRQNTFHGIPRSRCRIAQKLREGMQILQARLRARGILLKVWVQHLLSGLLYQNPLVLLEPRWQASTLLRWLAGVLRWLASRLLRWLACVVLRWRRHRRMMATRPQGGQEARQWGHLIGALLQRLALRGLFKRGLVPRVPQGSHPTPALLRRVRGNRLTQRRSHGGLAPSHSLELHFLKRRRSSATLIVIPTFGVLRLRRNGSGSEGAG